MKLMVPDVVVGATGEKTLRQYRYAAVTSPSENIVVDFTVAVTNRRLIQHAEKDSSKRSTLIHNEIFIENIGGFSFYRGKRKEKNNLFLKLLLFFLLFGGAAGVLFWQASPIIAAVQGIIPSLQDTLGVKIALAALPVIIYIALAVSMVVRSKAYIINMIIYATGLKPLSLFSDPEQLLYFDDYIVIPHLKETKAMISELSSIILDIQKFGSDEVLKYIDSEDSAR